MKARLTFFLTSLTVSINDFAVLDPDINFSDHLPLAITLSLRTVTIKPDPVKHRSTTRHQRQLRWDKADSISFYRYTYDHLTTVLEHIDELVSTYDRGACSASDCCEYIDAMYNEIVFVLANAADMYVPVRRKNFYKFWWDEELYLLKEASVDENKLWKAAGKPRHGPVYDSRQASRRRYRKLLRD